MFGRGGEEAEALATAGVPFEVVPGVTSATAGPAAAGIPVTHRDWAASVAIATAHEAPGKAGSRLDWEALARADTAVLLMGVERLADVAKALIAAGKPRSTPAAVIASATLPSQRTVTAPLSRIATAAKRAGIEPPAITVVGDVVRLREMLGGWDTRPLSGARVARHPHPRASRRAVRRAARARRRGGRGAGDQGRAAALLDGRRPLGRRLRDGDVLSGPSSPARTASGSSSRALRAARLDARAFATRADRRGRYGHGRRAARVRHRARPRSADVHDRGDRKGVPAWLGARAARARRQDRAGPRGGAAREGLDARAGHRLPAAARSLGWSRRFVGRCSPARSTS